MQGQTHQAGYYVVETDQFRRAVGSFETKKDLGWVFVVMAADVEGTLASDPEFLGDLVAASGEGQAGAHAATTIPWNGISQEGRAALQKPSNPVGGHHAQREV